ncbi:hypothetical protein V8G54_009810 [Vigna mungo]|uniref:Uncharacterized protein n=1 Tax=Vigna mungo TaxID=3915 RepID=A0AAQ3NWF3_VIGMU
MLHCVVKQTRIHALTTTSPKFLQNHWQKKGILPNVQHSLLNFSIMEQIIRPHSHSVQGLIIGVFHNRPWQKHLEHNDQAQKHHHRTNPLQVIELLKEQPRKARSEPVRKRILLFSSELSSKQAPLLQWDPRFQRTH